MIKKCSISTSKRCELCDITERVARVVKELGIGSGTCRIFVPHTTAAVTINENADPSVARDLIEGLERIAPSDGPYTHAEGNSAAHIKSSIIGTDKTLPVEDGRLLLGTWQGVFFCEFDGPRQRNFFVGVSPHNSQT